MLALILYAEIFDGNRDDPFHVCVIEETVFQPAWVGIGVVHEASWVAAIHDPPLRI